MSSSDNRTSNAASEDADLAPQMSVESVASILSEEAFDFDDSALVCDEYDLPATSAPVSCSKKKGVASASSTKGDVHWRQSMRLKSEAKALHISMMDESGLGQDGELVDAPAPAKSKSALKKQRQRERKTAAAAASSSSSTSTSRSEEGSTAATATATDTKTESTTARSARTRNAKQQDQAEAAAAARAAKSFARKVCTLKKVDLVDAIDSAVAEQEEDDVADAAEAVASAATAEPVVRNLKKQVKQREAVMEQREAERANRQKALQAKLAEQREQLAKLAEEKAAKQKAKAKAMKKKEKNGYADDDDDDDDLFGVNGNDDDDDDDDDDGDNNNDDDNDDDNSESEHSGKSGATSSLRRTVKAGEAPKLNETLTCNDRWFPESKTETLEQIVRDAKDMTKEAMAKEGERCSVCLGDFTLDDESDHAVMLGKCRGGDHFFHRDCIKQALDMNGRCPNCFMTYGSIMGTQPRGTMSVNCVEGCPLPGTNSRSTYVITYSFGSGTQGPRHPSPGSHYSGTSRVAYLPGNSEGRKVLRLLMRSWDARVTFTIGQSVTTGCDNTTIWNGIHHKTSTHGGPTCFGYPDPTYLTRVQEELAALGIY